VGVGHTVIRIGDSAAASGTVDYTCDGTDDNIQFQGALDALPANGGEIQILAGNYDLANATTVTRALANVTIRGTGQGTYITCDGATAIFTAGGNNWTISNLRTDAGSLNMGATTGWSWENVTVNATYYAYRTDDATTASSWNIPTGRTATYVIAANDAPANVKAQADYVCDGTADNVEIQAAIDALPTYIAGDKRGGVVHLSVGNYYISTGIIMKQYCTLEGEGWRTTTIWAANALNADMITFSSPQYTSAIRHISLEGNSAGQALGWGITCNNVSGLLISDVAVSDCKDGCVRSTSGSEALTFRNVMVGSSPYGFYFTQSQIQMYDCVATTCTTTSYFLGGEDINLLNCVADEAIGTSLRSGAFTISGNRISLNHCKAYGDPTTSYLLRGFWLYYHSGAGIYQNISLYDCTVHNIKLVPGFSAGAFTIDVLAGVTLKGVDIKNCNHTGLGFIGLDVENGGTLQDVLIEGNYVEECTYPYVFDNVLTTAYPSVTIRNNVGRIAQGEIRTASGSLTGGAANAILFSWHNPEAQDILIKKVVINITTGDADAANIDCGIADDATYTNGGTEFFDDLTGETIAVYDSVSTAILGKQTVWVLCQDSASATDGWVVAKILTNDGSSIVGSYYIEYTGK
jgi:hypothetical protein